MGDKKVLKRETKAGVFEMNLDDFLKVVELLKEFQSEAEQTADAFMKFEPLSYSSKIAFICAGIETMAEQENKNYMDILNEVYTLMKEKME